MAGVIESNISTPVILTGPYRPDLLEWFSSETNNFCVEGGTGITYVLTLLLKEFVAAHMTGSTDVFSSGPGSMISDLRSEVAACNSSAMVWKGDDRFLVSLTCDDRAEF